MSDFDEKEVKEKIEFLKERMDGDKRKKEEDEKKEEPRYGHPFFYELTKQEEVLHHTKNHDYARGGHPLGNFTRVSTISKLYPKMDWGTPEGVAAHYLLKQLDAALWLMAADYEAKVEGPIDRWKDVSTYSKIIMIIMMEAKEKAGK